MLVCNVDKRLRDFALQIDFTVGDETLVIIGPSGCGKSTTLQLLSGLKTPDDGRISINEQPLFDQAQKHNIAPEARGIGVVFQHYALFPHLSVRANIAYGLKAKNISKSFKKQKVEAMMQSLDLMALRHRVPADLSGGEQQRVALARALIIEPQLLLLDEPLSALDVTTRTGVRRELKTTLASLEIPTILVSHDYEDAISLGDRILVMDQGQIIQEGDAEQLLHAPRSSFVSDFSGTNFFTGQVNTHVNGRAHIQVENTDATLQSTASASGSPDCLIAPWHIQLKKQKPNDEDMNVFAETVINILPYGNRIRVEMAGELPLTAEISPQEWAQLHLQERDSVYAVISPDHVQLLNNENGQKDVAD